MSRQTINLLRFYDVIDIQKLHDNPQSQKSCRKAGIFVFELSKQHYWTQRHGATERRGRARATQATDFDILHTAFS